MSTLARTRLRIAGDAANFDAPLDVLRRATPQFWRGNDVQFEIAVFFNGALQDVSNLASLTLEVRPLGSGGAAPDPGFTPLMGATVSSFDNTTTLDDWNAGTKQHAVVTFTAGQSNIVAGAAWLSIFVITNDSPGRVITLCAGPVRVLEDGAGLATTPSPAGDTFYTAAESDARYAPIGGDDGAAAWGSIAGTLASQSDLNSALAAKAPLASPAFTGAPTAPTVSPASDSTTKVATTAFVQAAIAAAGSGSGSVTSVALSVPDILSVAGSPITSSGTLAVTLANQNANLIFAGPGSGSAAAPAFRSLVAADIPAIAQAGVTGLTSALAALAPLASPAFTGTPTASTASGSDNSTTLATTAWVRGYTAPITNDGSGHYIFGGGSAYSIYSGYTAILTVNGGFVANSSLGEHRLLNSYTTSDGDSPGYLGNVLSIQATDSHITSGVRFISSANLEVGAIGWCNSDVSHPAAGSFFVSASEPYPVDGTTIDPIAPPAFCLFQEGSWNGDSTLHQSNRIRFETNWDIGFYTPFAGAGGGTPARMIYIPMTPTGSSPTMINYGISELRVIGTPAHADVTSTTSTHSSAQFTAINGDGNSAVLAAVADNASYHAYPANGMWVGGGGPGGVAVMATNSSGVINFFTGGDQSSNARMLIDAAGNLLFSNSVTSAPSVTLASGQYQITVYDDGTSPVLRVRYNNGSAVKIGDLALA